MSIDIKLYVHGVPNGQNIWGNPGTDKPYILAFYGLHNQLEASDQMLVEIRDAMAYYTYIYSDNKLQDKDGRPGGYLALTVRINQYYSYIQNIYHLLEAAFNSYIVGHILEPTAGGYRFMIAQFDQDNRNLSELEGELNKYLINFSSNHDFVPLAGLKSNSSSEYVKINPSDATPKKAFDIMKSTGKLSVSAKYPSAKEADIAQKKDSEIQMVKADCQKKITATKNESKTIEDANKNLKKQNDNCVAKINELEATKKDLTGKLAQINSLTVSYKGHNTGRNIPPETNPTPKQMPYDNHYAQRSKTIRPSMLMLIIILCINCVILTKSFDKGVKEQPERGPLAGLVEETTPKSTYENYGVYDNTGGVEVTGSTSDLGSTLTDSQKNLGSDKDTQKSASLKSQYPRARIDISDINEATGNYMSVSSGKQYTISIKNGPEDINGEWHCSEEDFDIVGNTIRPKRDGKDLCICYYVNGELFLTRTITVVK
ncbi:MAG: hypothetical protein ACI306_04870 [Muribaculaceae bacterium]